MTAPNLRDPRVALDCAILVRMERAMLGLDEGDWQLPPTDDDRIGEATD